MQSSTQYSVQNENSQLNKVPTESNGETEDEILTRYGKIITEESQKIITKGSQRQTVHISKYFHRSKDIFEKEYVTVFDEFANELSSHQVISSYLINIFYGIFMMIKLQLNDFCDVFFKLLPIFNEQSKKTSVKLICLIIALLLAISRSRKEGAHYKYRTRRFFPQHSFVTDFPYGELTFLKEELLTSDMSFVLYYAPWDRQSQNLRSHFLKTAAYHHEQVSFAAVNCWLPESECRSIYKLQYYPVLVLHIRIPSSHETFNIPYNGPLEANYMIRFLSHGLQPFSHIFSEADLLALQLDYQVVVIGYFELTNDNLEFLSFFYAAVNRFQYEHMRDITYALVTNPVLAKTLSLSSQSSIQIITWNNTIIYPLHVEKNPRNITLFVNRHLYQVTQWLNLDGRKSALLNSIIKEGPVLLLMAPDNPYHFSNDLFTILRSVALEYFNCQNSSLSTWLADHLMPNMMTQMEEMEFVCKYSLNSNSDFASSVFNSLDYRNVGEQAEEFDQRIDTCRQVGPNFFNQISWSSVMNYMESYIVSKPMVCLVTESHLERCSKMQNRSSQSSSSSVLTEMVFKSPRGPKEDETVAQLIETSLKDRCKRLVWGASLPSRSIAKIDFGSSRITGLSCRTNQTLRFVAVDSILHQDFAHQLGINTKINESKYSGAVIIDPEKEERYLLTQTLTRRSLVEFVLNFTDNHLIRGKLSVETAAATHSSAGCYGVEVCFEELTANNYEQITQHSNKSYLVFHYTKNCGACKAVSHALLSAMHITSDFNSLQYARIDVSKNTLPWHLTFERVPAIILFPSNRKLSSKVLDIATPITVQSILLLVSYGLKPSDRLKLAYKVCTESCHYLARNLGLMLLRKSQISIRHLMTKYQRYIGVLIDTKFAFRETNDSKIKSKYDLVKSISSLLNKRLQKLKRKVLHLRLFLNCEAKLPFNGLTEYKSMPWDHKLWIWDSYPLRP